MKNKIIKILSIIIISLILILTFSQVIMAWTPDYTKVTSKSANQTEDAIYNILGATLTIVKVAGVGIAVIMLVVIGIQYIWASPEGRADYKKTAMPYVIGAVILFSASSLVGIIQNFAEAAIG